MAADTYRTLYPATDGATAQTRGYLATLQANPNHKMMVAMVNSNRVYSSLLSSATIPMTIFAPTDSVSKQLRIVPDVEPICIPHVVLLVHPFIRTSS
jgi:hypothetical protein